MQTYTAVRYVTPLREGGSLPALLETEAGELYVAKFRGAGQGARVLIAELITGLLAQHLGLPMPALALLHLDASFGRTERDPEIQDILKGSRGLNIGLRYLEGAFNYDPLAGANLVTPRLAADVVWLDAYTTNIDRTPRNPNLMVWQDGVQLIDHGASLYFHYNWTGLDATRIHSRFPMIKDHVLLPLAGSLSDADARLAPQVTAQVLQDILVQVPDALLMDAPDGHPSAFPTAEANRAAYFDVLHQRLQGPRAFVEAAIEAQDALRAAAPQPLPYRR